jgi:endo-1,4-beta-D-glucanase Y
MAANRPLWSAQGVVSVNLPDIPHRLASGFDRLYVSPSRAKRNAVTPHFPTHGATYQSTLMLLAQLSSNLRFGLSVNATPICPTQGW